MLIGLEGVEPRTEDMLDFLIVGGGIAGLSCAWSLRQAGHQVTVLEQNDQLWKCREAIHCIPTMTKILNDWGISDLVSKVATVIRKVDILDGATGENLGVIAFDGKVLESFPAEVNSFPYGELYRIFYNLAIQAGVQIRLKVKVVSVDPWIPMVTTADGERMTADVIIGADGLNSIVRSVFEEPVAVPGLDIRYILNLVASADLLRQDEELAQLVDSRTWTGWLADDCVLHAKLAGSGSNRYYSLTIHLPPGRESWRRFPICDELLNLFEPRVQKIFKVAELESEIAFVDYEPFDSWVHESGKVVMVGEAAHPVMPSGSYNGATSFEDAMTLSALFSLPATRSQTTMLLGVFEELRQPRCAEAQRYDRRKHDVGTMAHGPKQELRDRILRRQLALEKCEGTSDDFLRFYYSGLLQMYGFDPREVIQDWWVTFGRNVLLRSPQPEPEVDIPGSEPLLVAAQVEGEGLRFRDISDVLVGEYVNGAVSEDEFSPCGTD